MDFLDVIFPKCIKTVEMEANFNLGDERIFPLPALTESLHFNCHQYAELHAITSLTRLSTLSFSPHTVFMGDIHLPATLTSLCMPAQYTGPLILPHNLQVLEFPKNARGS